jgi:hypothetical protein
MSTYGHSVCILNVQSVKENPAVTEQKLTLTDLLNFIYGVRGFFGGILSGFALGAGRMSDSLSGVDTQSVVKPLS